MDSGINQLITKLMTALNPRQKEVLEKRFGLKDSKVMTLEALGKTYGVTRERIRQIEEGALKELELLVKKGVLNDLVKKVTEHLNNLGGLRREALLLADLQILLGEEASNTFDNKIKFLLDLAENPKYSVEDNEFYSYWYLEADSRKKAVDFVKKLIKNMETKKQEVISHRSLAKVFEQSVKPEELKELIALNYISLSKKFHINQFGDFGLSHWEQINPKTVRDWAHLILHKENTPMHFTNITKKIDTVRGSTKVTNPQTVHNELIKDKRFVLVGRGIYGLQDFGFAPGNTKEVMARILKAHGPLTPRELLELVLKERMLKKNTIFVNLQNRKYFKRLEDGKYTVNMV